MPKEDEKTIENEDKKETKPVEGEGQELTEEEKQAAIEAREKELQARSASGEEPPKQTPVEQPQIVPPGDDDDDPDTQTLTRDQLKALIDEAVKPLVEKTQKQDEQQRQKARESFFIRHPEYLRDAKRWQRLLDEMEYFDPSSHDYGKLLEKAHVVAGGGVYNEPIERKKEEIAQDTSSGGGSAIPRKTALEGVTVTAKEREIAKAWGASDEALAKFKEMEKNGEIQLFYSAIDK